MTFDNDGNDQKPREDFVFTTAVEKNIRELSLPVHNEERSNQINTAMPSPHDFNNKPPRFYKQ